MSGGVFNRFGRRSGGDRRFSVRPPGGGLVRLVSIQCYERRCAECDGTMLPFNPGRSCQCKCHSPAVEVAV